MVPKPLGMNTKKVPNHLRHPLEKFETEPNSFDMFWHLFCHEVDRETSQIWRPQISLHRAYLPLELTYKNSPRCQEEACAGFLPRFARLQSRRAVEHGQKNTSTCSTHLERARARPAPDPARPAPRQATPMSPARARAYKAGQGFSHTLPRALDLTGARDRRSLPCTRRASGRPIPRHRRPTSRAIPNPVQPSRETLRASVKLPARGIELCLTGEPKSRSPDFNRPPANVDRAPR
jgi:hypothetical protein